uniref:Uncharacterized protein n=1 Tax=Electrophorus electricus TaxID=8005 RepID=A0A4W4FBD6_ELEEL
MVLLLILFQTFNLGPDILRQIQTIPVFDVPVSSLIGAEHSRKPQSSQNSILKNPKGPSERGSTKDRSNTDRGHIMGVVRVHSESKTKTTDESSKVTEKTVKESLVCLTQDQLQQILNTIQASGQNVQDDSNTHIQNGEQCVCLLFLEMLSFCWTGTLSGNSSPSGLFSTFGQREREREALEAKRAQWKRELDEQMVLKQQQKANTEVPPQGEPCCGSCAGTSSSDQLLQVSQYCYYPFLCLNVVVKVTQNIIMKLEITD